MVKKLLCLLLILACSLAVIACGGNDAAPTVDNSQVDDKDTPETPDDKDDPLPPAEDDGNDDLLPPADDGAAPVLPDPSDNEAELPDAGFFKIIERSEPTVITTYTYTEDNKTEKGYEGLFTTTVYSENSYKFEYNYQKANKVTPDSIGESAVETVEGVVLYKNGLYSVNGGESWMTNVPDVDVVDVKLDINRDYLGRYVISKDGKTLNARISAANAEKLLGIEINADGNIDIRIATNGTYLSRIDIEYESDAAQIKINTTYSYEPVVEDNK